MKPWEKYANNTATAKEEPAPGPWSKYKQSPPEPTLQPQQDREPSYLGRIGQYWTKDLPEAGKGLLDRAMERSRRIEAPTTMGTMARNAIGNSGTVGQIVEGVAGTPERFARSIAGALGTLGDITGTTIGLAGKAADNLSGGNLSKAGSAAVKAIPGADSAREFLRAKAEQYGPRIQEWYDRLPEPDKANLASIPDLLGAFGIIPGGKALRKSVSYMDNVAKQSTEQFAPKAMKAMRKADDIIDQGWNKGIKPKVNGKKSFARMKGAADYNKEAVKTIVDLKDQLNIVDDVGERVLVPRNATEYAQGIEQAKKIICKQYTDMAKASGDVGAVFDARKVLDELSTIADERNIRISPKRRAYARAMIPEIAELQGAPLDVIQDRIAEYNSMLMPFYNDPNAFTQAEITANIAAALRSELDNKITSAVGPGYQKLKNQYGALKAVESEVNHRAIVNARRAKNSVMDFTDVFTNGEVLTGIMTGNGPLVLKGALGRATKEVLKAQNNPERYVKKMFRAADNLSESGQPLRGGVGYVLRQHETPKLTGPRRITDENRLLTYQMIGEQGAPQPGSMEVPIGAKIRNMGDKGIIDPKTANGRPTLPSPDDIRQQYAGTDYPQQFNRPGNRLYYPKAERLNPARLIEYKPGDAETVDMLGPRKRLPETIEIGKAVQPGTSAPVRYADAEKLMQDKGTIEEMIRLMKQIPKDKLTPDQEARIDDYLRVKGYRKKGKTKIGDILNGR